MRPPVLVSEISRVFAHDSSSFPLSICSMNGITNWGRRGEEDQDQEEEDALQAKKKSSFLGLFHFGGMGGGE